MKKILILLCIAAFPCLTVFGYGDNVGEIIGYVTEVNGDIVHVVGEPLKKSGRSNVSVNVGNAPIYDLITGFRVHPNDIQKDMDIRVAYNLNSETAVVIWLNWDEDDAAVFTVAVSENINNGAEGIVFLSTDGKYRVALSPDTIILDPYEGLLSPEEVTPGMEFFVWVDMITASTPALVYPDKVVVMH